MPLFKLFTSIVFVTLLIGCTTSGVLEYVTPAGEVKTTCETEYFGAPSVDKFAVEYLLSYCAKKADALGNKVIDKRLLTLDLAIPSHPDGLTWTFENATEQFKRNQLSNKEYGYVIAYVDLEIGNVQRNSQNKNESEKR